MDTALQAVKTRDTPRCGEPPAMAVVSEAPGEAPSAEARAEQLEQEVAAARSAQATAEVRRAGEAGLHTFSSAGAAPRGARAWAARSRAAGDG